MERYVNRYIIRQIEEQTNKICDRYQVYAQGQKTIREQTPHSRKKDRQREKPRQKGRGLDRQREKPRQKKEREIDRYRDKPKLKGRQRGRQRNLDKKSERYTFYTSLLFVN